MKYVYQIGAVPLFGALVDAVSLNEQRNWIVQTTRFQQAEGQFTHTPKGQRFGDTTEVSIQGTLTSSSHQHFLFTSSRLRALGGFKDVPLVVFETYNQTTLRWLYTTGSITSIDESSEYGDTIEGDYKRNISIQMKIDHAWRPLLPSYWESRKVTEYLQFPTAQVGVDNLFLHPYLVDTVYEQKERGFYFQKWDSSLSELAPQMWPYLYNGNGYGEDYAPFRSIYVLASEFAWPGQARAIYSFTNLLPQGTLTLQVNDFINTLDLDAMSTQMVGRGLGALQPSDELFVGHTTQYNSFIRRNGSIITQFTPLWEGDNIYPGAINPGLSKITFSGSSTTGNVAVNIEFGAL